MVNRLIGRDGQSWAIPALTRLTGQNGSPRNGAAIQRITRSRDLPGSLQAFLIASKVNGLSPKTLKGYEYLIGKFVSFCLELGLTNPAEVTVDDVRLFILKLQERNNSQSLHDYYRTIKRFFNWLIEEGVLQINPTAKIHPPRVEQKVIVTFKPEHIRIMLKLCDPTTFCGLRNRAMVFTFIDTGVRLKEMWSMRVDDIDFDRGVIKVHGKGAKERVVGIVQNTQKALLRYLLSRDDTHPCVWVTEERKPLAYEGLAQVFKTLKERAHFNDVRCSPHTFRHTFATMALDNGAGEFEVQALLGHNKLDMTRRYTASLNSAKAVLRHKRFSPVEHLKLE
jgi:integrase/recombinase XerC